MIIPFNNVLCTSVCGRPSAFSLPYIVLWCHRWICQGFDRALTIPPGQVPSRSTPVKCPHGNVFAVKSPLHPAAGEMIDKLMKCKTVDGSWIHTTMSCDWLYSVVLTVYLLFVRKLRWLRPCTESLSHIRNTTITTLITSTSCLSALSSLHVHCTLNILVFKAGINASQRRLRQANRNY